MTTKSNVHFYSIGIVASDKVKNTKFIDIIPIEVNFIEPTKVDTVNRDVDISHPTDTGETDNLKVKKGNTIRAQWWKFNSNRVSPPDVCKEDQVMILQLGETDIYFWMDLGTANVKRLEDVVFAFGADPANQMADDLSNAYVVNYSPMNGHITLRTCMANGEKAAFLFQFNTRDGTWQCADHLGNKYYLNSPEYDLGFENAMRSKVNINKENAFIFTVNSIKLESKTIQSDCVDWIVNAQSSMKHTTSTYTTDASSSTTFSTGKFTGSTPTAVFTGKLESKGNFKSPDAVIANFTFSAHYHISGGPGSPTSQPVGG